MNEEIIMSREAFEELVNGFEFIERLTKYGRINIKYHIQKLQEENKKLKKQLEEKNNKLNSVLDYIDSNIFIEQFENVGNENNVRKEIIKRITNDIEVE